MEVKPDFKQTDVGVIPADWGLKRLHLLITQPATYGVVKAGVFQSQGIRMLRGGDIKDGRVNDDLPLITKKKSAEYQRTVLSPSDVVISLVGYPGEAAVIPETLAGANISRAVGLLQPKSTLCSRFLTYYLNSPSGRAEFLRPGAGSAQMVVNLRDLNLLWVPLPPTKAEQEAIAEVLSDADALIESLENLLVKKRYLKQGTMQKLLTGKKRLPGFSGEWKKKQLGDVLEKIIGGGTPSRSNPDYWGNGIPWVTVKDFATFHPRQTQESITWEGLRQSASHLIPKGTLIISTRMALGKAVVYEVDVSINQDLKALFPTQDLNVDFLYYWFEHYGRLIDDLGSGSTVKGISIADLKSLKFCLASREEQTAITAILSDMDTEIALLDAKLAKTRQLKQGMMQELLTGRIRLV